uniref:Ig-like domain-containing protein n=1 Tax=Monopterus albus TaxID=43700 RepID=A0A3Q3JIR8_MONAL
LSVLSCLLAYLLPYKRGDFGDFVEPSQLHTSLLSLAESQTKLPCHYQAQEGQKVVQVSWYKELPDGSKDQIITAHFKEGHTEFGRYSGRVRFESSSPTDNSALLIPNTEDSDEGSYTCHISTFPYGNFERHIQLTVWTLPISSLEPVDLVEGQSFRIAATCRAVGRPVPRLSWDTDLPGQSQNRTSEGGSVSSYYSLHPLRSMNGKKLDCLVWHPGLAEPRRISNRLVVQYPPDATISSRSGDWYVGLQKAELLCDSGGYPKPQNITWTWKGGALPDGVSVVGGKLVFERPVRMNDSGAYECFVKNNVGVDKTEYMLRIAETSPRKGGFFEDNLLAIIIGAAAAALVVALVIIILLVNHYHRHRNKKLEMELSEKKSLISCHVFQDSGLPSSLVPLKAQQDDGVGPREPDLGHPSEGDSPRVEDWTPALSGEGGQEDDDSSNSYQISEALNNHFYYSNGLLRPKPHSNAILLQPRTQVV